MYNRPHFFVGILGIMRFVHRPRIPAIKGDSGLEMYRSKKKRKSCSKWLTLTALLPTLLNKSVLFFSLSPENAVIIPLTLT